MNFPDLLRKYDVAGPRYTSYPTVPYWTDSPTIDQWLQFVSDEYEKKRSLGIYIHVPFCERLCTYCGCNTRITRSHDVALPYVETLLREWSIYKNYLIKKSSSKGPLEICEIHLGGGTPTFLSSSELSRLIQGILQDMHVMADHEFSIEVDPRVTQEEQLKVLYDLGFRRISLGVQDFDPKVQEIVHRIQSFDQVARITEISRRLGYTSVNFDLIYGLPLQTEESIVDTMKKVRSLRPDRIAFYGYAHVPWIKPGQRRFSEDDLPQGDAKRVLYEKGRTLLEEAGYTEIGMDHFALPHDRLLKATSEDVLHRNFMGYTSRQVAPLIGLGVSSIGDAWSAFAQNEKVLENYTQRVNKGELPLMRGHILNSEDLAVRRTILNLMTQLETPWNFNEAHSESFSLVLQEFEKDGLVEISREKIKVTRLGRSFLRNICMAFDQRLRRSAPQTQIFSRTI